VVVLAFSDNPISYVAIIAAVFILLYYVGLHFSITLPQALIVIAIGIIVYLAYTRFYKK